MTPQFVDHGFSKIDKLNNGAGIWSPATRVVRPKYVDHWSVQDQYVGESTVVGEAASAKSDFNYKTDFEVWRETQIFEHQKIAMSRPPVESIPVGAKMLDAKTPAMDLTPISAKKSDAKTPETDSLAPG